MSDEELRQLAKDREYEEAWESSEVQSWLASLSPDERAIVKASHCDKASVSHAGPAIKSREADERAQQRIDNIVAEKNEEHSPEDEFAFSFEEEARRRGVTHVDPAVMGAALAAFSSQRGAEDTSAAIIKTYQAIAYALSGSQSAEAALRTECVAIVKGTHPQSQAEVGRRYGYTRANIQKIIKDVRKCCGGLRAGGQIKLDDYAEQCRLNAKKGHATRKAKADARAKETTQLSCPKTKPSSLLSQASNLSKAA